MIILGIDPGTTRVGFGVIRYEAGNLKFIEAGIIPIDRKGDDAQRLREQRIELNKLIEKHNPDKAAVEILFFAKNTKTAIRVAQARGVIMEILGSKNVSIKEFTPLQAKQAISGYGRATKEQVQRMVQLILGLKQPPRPDDVADALALAICCAHSLSPI